jgi:hypothetical protein
MGREGGATRWAVEEENEREREASRGGKRDGFSDWFRKVKVSLSSKTHARFDPAQY